MIENRLVQATFSLNKGICPSAKIGKNSFFKMQFVTSLKTVGPNLKPYFERFLSEFYENGKSKIPSTTND